MFTQKKKEYYSKILGFKTIEDFEEFSKRYLKYLENQTLTKNRVMGGFFILIETQKEALKNHRIIKILLQVKIADEETKQGYESELLLQELQNTLLELENEELVIFESIQERLLPLRDLSEFY